MRAVILPSGRRDYPWRHLDKGDSFVILNPPDKLVQSIRTLAWRNGRNLKVKFSVAKHKTGLNVTRIK